MPRFLELSSSRQALVRLCQSINHGYIKALHVVRGEPSFSPAPVAVVDVKLDHDESPRPEIELRDFEPCHEVRRLLDQVKQIESGEIERIEVRAGVPRRLVFQAVYDPFLGSGTTLAAAELTERVCFGIELDPKYVDVIVQRWETLSGKKAKLEGAGRTFEEIAAERKAA